ncbi:Ras-related protein Rab-26-like [Oopsacas minuta]|uniref:Ras-related protein Rab-26-like n=1 Tax=Oopsacas minuta TaxID=111878 RepID=A0AAV7K5C5_9METZ|nr:Ras-related protein Rab-26-like [Oopsacas minuta]
MLHSTSLPSVKYCGDPIRKGSLTEYAYFIFCNCLPSPADRRQEGSLKLLRKRFPELYGLMCHDLSACLTDNMYITEHKQVFGMCHLETALEQYCSRNGYDSLPYTAASSAISANLQRTQSLVVRSAEVALQGEESIEIGRKRLSKSEEISSTPENKKEEIELTNQFTELDVHIVTSNSQTESFLMRVENSPSSEDTLDIYSVGLLKEKTALPRNKVTSFAPTVISYDADMSSEPDTFISSTPIHEYCKKRAKHSDSKRPNTSKKLPIAKVTSLNIGPDCHGPDRIFKVVMLGNSGVGKSSLVSALVLGNARYAIATIGVDMVVKTFMVQGMKVSLQIWDTAGEERFHCMAPSYIRKADAVILVYDISDHTSFVDIPLYWLPFTRRYLSGEAVSLLLLGNKTDKSSQRVITGEDGYVLSRDAKMVFREVSSRDCDTISSVYHSLAQTLVAKENEELDKFSQLTITMRRAQIAMQCSPKHSRTCIC